METPSSDWLTVQQAATLAGCSTKTLYRYMDRKQLSYKHGADNRRYLKENEVRKLFPTHPFQAKEGPVTVLAHITAQLRDLAIRLDRLERLVEHAIRLYQPATMKQLADKQAAIKTK